MSKRIGTPHLGLRLGSPMGYSTYRTEMSSSASLSPGLCGQAAVGAEAAWGTGEQVEGEAA